MTAGHTILAVLGGTAEVVGFGLVLRESNRARHEDLGEIGRFRAFWDAIRETIRNPAPQIFELHTAASVSATGSLRIDADHRDENPVDELRRRVDGLGQDLAATREQLDAHAQEIRNRVDGLDAGLSARILQLHESRRSDIDRRIRNEKRGAGIFLLGVAFNLAANLVA